MSQDETNTLRNSMFIEEKGCALNADIVGKSPYQIAKGAGIEVPIDTKVLVLKENGIGIEYPFSKEKLSPVLAYYIVENADEGINIAERLIEFGGLGHSAVIHSENEQTILKFSEKSGLEIFNFFLSVFAFELLYDFLFLDKDWNWVDNTFFEWKLPRS